MRFIVRSIAALIAVAALLSLLPLTGATADDSKTRLEPTVDDKLGESHTRRTRTSKQPLKASTS